MTARLGSFSGRHLRVQKTEAFNEKEEGGGEQEGTGIPRSPAGKAKTETRAPRASVKMLQVRTGAPPDRPSTGLPPGRSPGHTQSPLRGREKGKTLSHGSRSNGGGSSWLVCRRPSSTGRRPPPGLGWFPSDPADRDQSGAPPPLRAQNPRPFLRAVATVPRRAAGWRCRQ